MLQTIEAIIDDRGQLKFMEDIAWRANQHVLVTFLPKESMGDVQKNYSQLMDQLAYVQAGKKI